MFILYIFSIYVYLYFFFFYFLFLSISNFTSECSACIWALWINKVDLVPWHFAATQCRQSPSSGGPVVWELMNKVWVDGSGRDWGGGRGGARKSRRRWQMENPARVFSERSHSDRERSRESGWKADFLQPSLFWTWTLGLVFLLRYWILRYFWNGNRTYP